MENELRAKIDSLMEYTTKLSFPMFASENKKETLLNEIRTNIDNEIAALLKDKSGFEEEKSDLWNKAQVSANKEFETLPTKLKLNSFYLQEVMHQYVELIQEYLFS